MTVKLSKAEETTLQQIASEARACTCQFPRYGDLERKGLVVSDRCNVMGHGYIHLTEAGRRALHPQTSSKGEV